MSAPFLIWTLRRTGGTTLTALLTDLSEHPGTQHEPFNPERRFGAVTTRWREEGNRARLRADIAKALEGRPVLKHCYEIAPPELNQVLMEIATDLGYRHIVLDRREETDRVLSLELAKSTGAWGSEDARRIYAEIETSERKLAPLDVNQAVAHLRQCFRRRSEIRDLFAANGQEPHIVYFEDVYRDPEAGRARVSAVLAYLGIDPSAHCEYESRLTDALMTRGQNSAQIMSSVPNIDQVRDALEAAQENECEVFVAS